MKFELTLGNWETQQVLAQAIRYDVFVIEQGIPVELERSEERRVGKECRL